jgi:hypothetical protein
MCILFKISDYIIIKILAGCVVVLAALIGQMILNNNCIFASPPEYKSYDNDYYDYSIVLTHLHRIISSTV